MSNKFLHHKKNKLGITDYLDKASVKHLVRRIDESIVKLDGKNSYLGIKVVADGLGSEKWEEKKNSYFFIYM